MKAPTTHADPSLWLAVRHVGTATLAVGALLVLAAIIINAATAQDAGGANIGAGIIFLLGMVPFTVGTITTLTGVIGGFAERRRSEH